MGQYNMKLDTLVYLGKHRQRLAMGLAGTHYLFGICMTVTGWNGGFLVEPSSGQLDQVGQWILFGPMVALLIYFLAAVCIIIIEKCWHDWLCTAEERELIHTVLKMARTFEKFEVASRGKDAS